MREIEARPIRNLGVAVPVLEVAYLELKKLLGAKGKTRNIPDAYLIDLSSAKEPRLFLVENELQKHDPLKHIAVQILEFSLSFETTPQKLKRVLKEAVQADDHALRMCVQYAEKHGYENLDVLLERLVYGQEGKDKESAFNALVIIDELEEELETVLISRFKFPVEIITIQRFADRNGDTLYEFEPFLHDVVVSENGGTSLPRLDPSEIDTAVVPARDEGFEETFLGEDCWYKVRLNASMIPKIKYCAAYRVRPISAITHIAPVSRIEPYKDTNKYILYFSEPAKEVEPIKLVKDSKVKALQNLRYTSKARLDKAKNLDGVF